MTYLFSFMLINIKNIIEDMLSLDLIKKHLNIEKDFKEDDLYLLNLAETAEKVVRNHLDVEEEKLYNDEGEYKAEIRQAMLMIIGTWYQTRESISYGVSNKVNHGYDYILQQLKSYEW